MFLYILSSIHSISPTCKQEYIFTHQTTDHSSHHASDLSIVSDCGSPPWYVAVIIITNAPTSSYTTSTAALYSQQDSYRRCIHDAEHRWFVLELLFSELCICAASSEPIACVCSMLCCGDLPHNLHCQPEKQVYFGGFWAQNNNVWVPVCVLSVATDYRPSQGSPGAFKGLKKAAIIQMLNAVLNCFQLQFLLWPLDGPANKTQNVTKLIDKIKSIFPQVSYVSTLIHSLYWLVLYAIKSPCSVLLKSYRHVLFDINCNNFATQCNCNEV